MSDYRFLLYVIDANDCEVVACARSWKSDQVIRFPRSFVPAQDVHAGMRLFARANMDALTPEAFVESLRDFGVPLPTAKLLTSPE
jgi:hypothetical protein